MSTTLEEDVAQAEQQIAVPQPVPGPPAGFTVDKMVEKYVALRDKLAEIKKVQSADNARFTLAMGTLEAWLIDALNNNRVESMRAAGGTFYKSTSTAAKVVKWSDTLAFIQEHGAWELLEARVSKTAVEAIIAETSAPIPGVEITRETRLNVRKS